MLIKRKRLIDMRAKIGRKQPSGKDNGGLTRNLILEVVRLP
jgi:hypothetical protein